MTNFLLELRTKIVQLAIKYHDYKQRKDFDKNYMSRPNKKKNKTKYTIPTDYSKLYMSCKDYNDD